MATSDYLFTIANDGKTDSPGLHLGSSSAPTLVPINANGQLIDVTSDFPWTNSIGGDSVRADVPRLILKEYNITRSSLYQQARYLLSSLPDATLALQQGINNIGIGKVLVASTIAGATVAGTGKKIIGAAAGALAALTADSSLPAAAANGVVKLAQTADLTDKPNTNLKNYLKPYDNLYATKATKFSYSLPYFSSDWKNAQVNYESLNSATFNKFDSALKDISTSILGGGIGGIGGVGSLQNIFPCAYSETPKIFKYTDGSENKIKVSFQLFNTTKLDDIIRNWQLCFLLMYQNLPNRNSRVLVDVPCIYELNVAGLAYIPYAFMSQISINQLGATRKVTIPIAISNSQAFSQRAVSTSSGIMQVNVRPPAGEVSSSIVEANFETLIPDVFEINIEFTSLVAESKNLLYQAVVGNNDSVYDVSVLPSTQP